MFMFKVYNNVKTSLYELAYVHMHMKELFLWTLLVDARRAYFSIGQLIYIINDQCVPISCLIPNTSGRMYI